MYELHEFKDRQEIVPASAPVGCAPVSCTVDDAPC